MLPRHLEDIYAKMSPSEKAVVDAIMIANQRDESAIIDSVISDVNQRRAQYFDILYIDLSIDRSAMPLEISGAATGLLAIEATDNNAELSVSFELPDQSVEKRVVYKRGRRFFAPMSKFYIYHGAQAGKYMKLMRVMSTRSIFAGFEDDSGEAANSDLVVALGNSAVISTGQVAVGTSATLISAANTSRKRITITNNDAGADLYIGPTGVTTATGLKLAPGASIVLNTTAAIYGDGSSPLTASYLEE